MLFVESVLYKKICVTWKQNTSCWDHKKLFEHLFYMIAKVLLLLCLFTINGGLKFDIRQGQKLSNSHFCCFVSYKIPSIYSERLDWNLSIQSTTSYVCHQFIFCFAKDWTFHNFVWNLHKRRDFAESTCQKRIREPQLIQIVFLKQVEIVLGCISEQM